MDLKTNSPAEIAQIWVTNGVNKAKLSPMKKLLLSILAGMFIAYGATGYLFIMGNYPNPGFNKLLGALVFPCGLMLVVFAGAELWTGNNLMTLAVMDKKLSIGDMLTSWAIVYCGNIIGSYFFAWLVYTSGMFAADPAMSVIKGIAVSKVGLTLVQAITRAIMCNILVVLACWMQAASKDLIGKIVGLWFPIMLFVVSGYEHSIANMFYLPLGQLLGAPVTFADAWLKNIIPVTIGNLIGGAIIIPFFYWFCYLRGTGAPAATAKKK